jgi:hypothetical protein
MTVNIDTLIKFEEGELSPDETIEFFAGLIKSGTVWQLQGFYGRTANDLIEAGYIDSEGNVLTTEVE